MAAPPVVTVPEVDAYFLPTSRNAEWVAVTTPEVWVHEAQVWLGQLCLDATKTCCGMPFDQAWLMATSELALALSKNPSAVIGGGTSTPGATGLIKRQKLGDLEVEYDNLQGQTSVQASRFGPDDPIVLQRFPWMYDILGCYLSIQKTSGTRVIARVRS